MLAPITNHDVSETDSNRDYQQTPSGEVRSDATTDPESLPPQQLRIRIVLRTSSPESESVRSTSYSRLEERADAGKNHAHNRRRFALLFGAVAVASVGFSVALYQWPAETAKVPEVQAVANVTVPPVIEEKPATAAQLAPTAALRPSSVVRATAMQGDALRPDESGSPAVRRQIVPEPAADSPRGQVEQAEIASLQADAEVFTDPAAAEVEVALESGNSSDLGRRIAPTRVARAQFTRGISGREPVDDAGTVIQSAQTGSFKLYFFTELRELTGEEVTHRWFRDGRVYAEVGFRIGGPQWRVYSSKNLNAAMAGRWKVEVVDSKDNVLETRSFTLEFGD